MFSKALSRTKLEIHLRILEDKNTRFYFYIFVHSRRNYLCAILIRIFLCFCIVNLITFKVINIKDDYYVFHGRVTLFFANNSLMQCRITMKLLHYFF